MQFDNAKLLNACIDGLRKAPQHHHHPDRQRQAGRLQPQSAAVHRADGRNHQPLQAPGVVDGIKHQKIGDAHFYAQELFAKDELTGYLRKMPTPLGPYNPTGRC